MTFDPGSLNSLVRIQAQSTAQDALGQPLLVWADVATVWADVRMPNGMQSIKADASVSVAVASIRIRFRTGLDAGMRVLHGTTVYQINAVLPDVAGREFVDLVCQVVT